MSHLKNVKVESRSLFVYRYYLLSVQDHSQKLADYTADAYIRLK
jgi:hypothetical protein